MLIINYFTETFRFFKLLFVFIFNSQAVIYNWCPTIEPGLHFAIISNFLAKLFSDIVDFHCFAKFIEVFYPNFGNPYSVSKKYKNLHTDCTVLNQDYFKELYLTMNDKRRTILKFKQFIVYSL